MYGQDNNQDEIHGVEDMPDGERVLIIDDDPEFARVLRLLLKRKGYEVITALSGIEGFNQAVKERPDVILLDLMIPDIDGYEVFRRIRLNPGTRYIPVVFVTARSSEEDIARGFAVGIQGYLTKPFERDELYSALDNAISEGMLSEGYDYLESLFDVASAPMLVWDPQMRIVRSNHALERLTGYEAWEIMGKDMSALLPEERRQEYKERIRGVTAGESWDTLEMPISCKGGEERYILWSTANVYGNDGQTLVATIAQGQDVTERKQVEEQLRKLNIELEERVRLRTAELEDANRELEAFTYSVSHDLRVPISSINSFSGMLIRDHSDGLDDSGKRILRIVKENAEFAEELINAMLRLSRVGRQDLDIGSVDMNSLTREVIEELKPAIGDRHVEFVVKDLPHATGDPGLLRQVIANLVSNSIKFTGPKERSRVEIGGSADGKFNTYFVRDNGVGFDMQFSDKLFKVFQRLHSDDEFEGTGVGLALVHRIIRRHGGEVWGEGNPGEGAVFYFKLPSKSAPGKTYRSKEGPEGLTAAEPQ